MAMRVFHPVFTQSTVPVAQEAVAELYTMQYQNDSCVLRARELVSCARAIWSLGSCCEYMGQIVYKSVTFAM
eukprot:4176570-Prymnesium_polylepis.1